MSGGWIDAHEHPEGEGSRLYVREDARLDWSENVGDDFSRNLIRFRAEARYGLAITRPLGFVSVDLTG